MDFRFSPGFFIADKHYRMSHSQHERSNSDRTEASATFSSQLNCLKQVNYNPGRGVGCYVNLDTGAGYLKFRRCCLFIISKVIFVCL